MTAPAPAPVWSGFCGVGRHQACRGAYSGHPCPCECHDQPPPAPLLEVGARVICARGTRWATEGLTGAELDIVQVHNYPPEVGGPVFISRWPGTTTTPGPHPQADRIKRAA